jgi:hypothetical protein
MVIEQVSGERWADYADRNTSPWHAASSVDKNVSGLAAAWATHADDREVLLRTRAEGGATGVTSNPEDMAKSSRPSFAEPARRGAVEHRIAGRDASRALG